jgi:preprotein translocase subunit Sec61beta
VVINASRGFLRRRAQERVTTSAGLARGFETNDGRPALQHRR